MKTKQEFIAVALIVGFTLTAVKVAIVGSIGAVPILGDYLAVTKLLSSKAIVGAIDYVPVVGDALQLIG